MSSQNEEETAFAGFASKVLHPFVKLVSSLNIGHSVHPKEPLQLANSEFITVNKNYKIRVLHVLPSSESLPKSKHNKETENNKRHSLTEEYWFTRWNKPLGTSKKCNCSFRRSQRYLKNGQEGSKSQVSSFEAPPTKIKDYTTFVERLIEEIIFEAVQEYIITKKCGNTNNTYDNLGFIKESTESNIVINPIDNENDSNKVCKHNTSKSNQKPFVFLLHGIGSSTEMWHHIIESLLNKGFEVAAPDMLGHGYSSAPNKRKAYKFKRLLDYSLTIFDHYAQKNEYRKFVVIGHSFGCSLATFLARYRSQQVVQLVLISGGGPTALSAPLMGSEISVFSTLQLFISPLLFCGIKRSYFYSPRGKHFKPCMEDSSIPHYVFDYIAKEQNWPEGDAAFHRRILIPTLLVHGLQDTQVTLVQECEMERTIPRAFLELIPTAGHMSITETPEQLSHMILCFIDWWSH